MRDNQASEVDCIVPPAPELYDKIVRSKEIVATGDNLPTIASADHERGHPGPGPTRSSTCGGQRLR